MIVFVALTSSATSAVLQVGFATVDITPKSMSGIYLAGYGWNRTATGVHDPIYCRAIVLHDGKHRIALASVDLVGLQYPFVQEIRQILTGFEYVMVASTHSHQGPDTIGLWGKSPFHRGVNGNYMSLLKERIVACINQANATIQPATAVYGVASDETLLHDRRKPVVKDGNLRVLRFLGSNGKTSGLLVQWNCHPESLGSQNRRITADFPCAVIAALQTEYDCPVAYFSGALGGLMAPPNRFTDEHGTEFREGDFEHAEVYGKAVADLATRAITNSKPIVLSPIAVHARDIAIPVTNPFYRAARLLGVVERPSVPWASDFEASDRSNKSHHENRTFSIVTEVGYLRLGELSVACIPGEIYPELVYGQGSEPADPNVDFPTAPRETPIDEIVPDKRWLLFGLANDEIGYLIPKQQWDRVPPYAYGRKSSQYGEINSCGPDAADIICRALQNRVREAGKKY